MRISGACCVLAALSLCAAGCRTGKEAGGRETDVVVVASNEDWSIAGPVLQEAFSRPEGTPEAQTFFDLTLVRPQDIGLYRYRKNLLLVGSADSDLLKEVLGEESRAMVRSGESYMFGSLDAWIHEQILVIIAAPRDKPLGEVIRLTAHSAFEYFRIESLARIRRRTYGAGIDENIKKETLDRYGWTLDLPSGYDVASDDSAGGLVSFIRHNPERVILVHWAFEKGSRSWVEMRDEMAASYLQGDKVVRSTVKEAEVDFRGYRALKLAGQWQNEQKVMGGPFVTYCFKDTLSGMNYMVDYNIFAPAKKKWPILGQMEWLAQTFTIYR